MLGTGGMGTSILITGGAGSIGTVLRSGLEREGVHVVVIDRRSPGEEKGDVRDEGALRRALRGCSGIVHLAAVSRVAQAERDPAECQSTNVDGTRAVLAAAGEAAERPWVLLASSREVYGEPDELPVAETTPLRPRNAYGRSKAEAEALVAETAGRGLRAAVVRLSNVYGSAQDHADRVVPAFTRAALRQGAIHVCGADRVFDFTHVDDVVRGLRAIMERLDDGEVLPPIQLVSGAGVSLGDLGRLAFEIAGSKAAIRERAAQGFEVSRFVGDPRRARDLLGWEAKIPLRAGLERLVRQWRTEPGDQAAEVSAS